MGNQTIHRNREYEMVYDFPEQFSGEGQGPTVCENCMGSLAACLTQTIVAHAVSRGIRLDSISVLMSKGILISVVLPDFPVIQDQVHSNLEST